MSQSNPTLPPSTMVFGSGSFVLMITTDTTSNPFPSTTNDVPDWHGSSAKTQPESATTAPRARRGARIWEKVKLMPKQARSSGDRALMHQPCYSPGTWLGETLQAWGAEWLCLGRCFFQFCSPHISPKQPFPTTWLGQLSQGQEEKTSYQLQAERARRPGCSPIAIPGPTLFTP